MRFSRIFWILGLGLVMSALWFACRKNFDLSNKEGAFGQNLVPKVRIDVTLDPSFLTAYSGRFRCLICGSVPCQDGCGAPSTGMVYSANIGNLRVARVLSGRQLLILLKGPDNHSKLITLPIIDTSRSQLLLRSKLLIFDKEQVGQNYSIEKAVVIDDKDSIILASPLRTPESCLSSDKCRYRDSLVDSAYRLPLKFPVPKFDSGILVINLRMSLAGKDLWKSLVPDSLGYTTEDFKTKNLSEPKPRDCSASCP